MNRPILTGYTTILPLLSALILSGCGGGGSSADVSQTTSDTSTSSTGEAFYVDAAISGINYRCGTREGTTDDKGTFTFETGEGCSFIIGQMQIRTVDASALSNGVTIFESNPNVAALLQSLDNDHDPENGIYISSAVHQAFKQLNPEEIPQNDTERKAMIEALMQIEPTLNLMPVSYAESIAHMQVSYAGYKTQQDANTLVLTDEDAFEQLASGPVLYHIPVMAKALSPESYGLPSLTDEEFNALPLEKRYLVAQKLYGSLFYAPPMEELKAAVTSGSFISDIHALFNRENSPSELAQTEEKVEIYAQGNSNSQVMAPMLARMFFLSPGKAYFNRWAAYILTQTILFTPAYELDTVYTVDAIDVYGDLVRDFDSGFSMQWSTFTHMISDENWRRFRSPEDNGREMLEIYLKDFNDAHVPLAAQALQNWKLDLRSTTLVVSLNENIDPITGIFPGRTITNGTDFYSAIVLSPDFLPVVTGRLIDMYFPNLTSAQKETLVTKLTASNPMTWTDVLKQIIYSKTYLLESEKPRSFEEAFYPIAKTLSWKPAERTFSYIVSDLDNMHQSTMRYKLGRKEEVPMDSQSFAWFHKSLRERVLIDYDREDPDRPDDAGWPLTKLFETLPSDLIDPQELDEDGKRTDLWNEMERKRAAYMIQKLFITVAGRSASPDEISALTDLIDNEKREDPTFKNFSWYDLYGNSTEEDNLKERGYFTQIVLDYISRLSEVYTFQSVQ